MASMWKRMCAAFEEALSFTEAPDKINGIKDSAGHTFTVQAPALKLLEPGVPAEIRLRFVSDGFADEPVLRTVVRRDSGVIPMYYFV